LNTNTPLVTIIDSDPTTKWGTANLSADAKIMLHVGSPTAVPIEACLTHPLVLGRFAGDDPEIHVNLEAYRAAELGVSRQHTSLTLITGTVILTDLNSLNGTFLNGRHLSPNQHAIVRDGDEIRLGQLVIYISYRT